ncbi:SOUL heme-binding protein [Planctomycetes bacterium Pla163]|uniref:SOUL heme-binding protein n=1 Tax=Rohdeia mirabilis TaxID=2528008 RepID=A0A518D0W7_9BACT|nr:SOUL heme-binding protein [Planctomycetes bacterium Pla163]
MPSAIAFALVLIGASTVARAAAPESAATESAAAGSLVEASGDASVEIDAHTRSAERERFELRLAVWNAEQPRRRTRAAETLRSALAVRGATLEQLIAAAERAEDTLLDGTAARLVETTATQARWRALSDRDAATAWLAKRLDGLASDLAFQPYLEADLPEGFPQPTLPHDVELKRYPRYRMATAPMGSGRQDGAFWKLFQHIQSNEIPMTAPVETTYEADGERMRATTMAFLYEGPEQGRAGEAGAVDVVDVGEQWVVSMGLRGYDSRERIDAAHAALLEYVAVHGGLEVVGEMRTMGYNSPMVMGARRTFEVQVPVRVQLLGDA